MIPQPAKKVKLKPLEVLGAVDKLSKEEKKAIRTLLQEEETEAAWASLETVRPYAHEAGAVVRATLRLPFDRDLKTNVEHETSYLCGLVLTTGQSTMSLFGRRGQRTPGEGTRRRQ